MKKTFIILCLAVFTLIGCNSIKNKKQTELRIAGGTAHIGFMKSMAEKMKENYPELNISVSGGGSGVGIKQVGEGLIDIGNSGRKVRATEIEKYGLKAYPVAIDGIAVIVHPSNRVNNLTMAQVKDIFAGKIANWKELEGGHDAPVNIYTRDAESGTRKVFAKLALENGEISEAAQFSNSNGNMKILVSNDENAIGYMSIGYLDESVKGLSIENITPDIENVLSGDYRIQRYLYMVTKGEPVGNIKMFVDKMLSSEGQKLVKEHNFTPLN